MGSHITLLLLAVAFWHLPVPALFLEFRQGDVLFSYSANGKGATLTAKRGDDLILNGVIETNEYFEETDYIGLPDYQLKVTQREDIFEVFVESNSTGMVFSNCFDFMNDTNWYGGPEKAIQRWPIEKLEIDGNDPYVIRNSDNFGVAERYWLNSKGVYIYVDENAPIYVDQNVHTQDQVCFTANVTGPYVNRNRTFLHLYMVIMDNPKEAHLHAINNFLGKPTGYPDPRMIREPIWTTWATYKRDISDEVVLNFAKEIRNQGYTNGQLEIDDQWETCYGAQVFDPKKFSNITNTIKELKNSNFRVTLWVHPFVNNDCQNNSLEGTEKGYFVSDNEGNVNASWWDGSDAHQIDFTKSEAGDWFSNRLLKLQADPGIDSFKFDAGETNYGHQPSVYDNVDPETIPNVLTQSYVRTCAKFGNLIELRSAWRTQDLPVFTRMMDKDSSWGENNGLYTLITTLLQLNMNGYPMVLPDMIGGNGYGNLPTAELIVRWTQANTFMPTMQFSYTPWEITSDDFDSAAIVKKYVDLHANYSSAIIEAMENSVKNGSPVNAPIWWIDPFDRLALASDDEFLLGDNILVAPVIIEGARSRNVYLPQGTWTDGNNGTIYKGPIELRDYPAPIEVLPYFIKS